MQSYEYTYKEIKTGTLDIVALRVVLFASTMPPEVGQ